jgi:nicotinate-nucleotide pyrophosphorylase (carboxylating)
MTTAPDDPSPFDPPLNAVREAVARALAEDLTPLGDLTSALLDPETHAVARFVARADGRLAGGLCARVTFAEIDPRIEQHWLLSDGTPIFGGDVIAEVRGPLSGILTAERTALNFLGHLSGIATETARYVSAAAADGGTARVWDTRKTTPGLRALEKAAVRAGGGRNHRGNLSDWILLKDNHITGIGITEAVLRARDRWPGRTVHVECDRIEQMLEAIEAGCGAVLLDNMEPATVTEAVARARQLDPQRRCLLEVSGGITLATISTYARTGVDMISIGRITNSAPTLDIGLDIG